MRALTSAQSAAIAVGDYSVHCRVFVDRDGTTNMTDLTNVEGRDWLESVELKDGVDDNGMAATIMLRREEYNLSLATLMQDSKLNQQPIGSYVPFVTIARDVRIETAVTPVGQAPTSSDWINSFEGEIDDVDWGGDGPLIKLTCRDNSGYLIDRWVESNSAYGTSNGQLVETVMQNILTAWAPGVTLYTPVSPAWAILPYEQQKEPVMDALRKLAQQIGWDVKYRWDSGSSAWRLTLYQPDRAKVVPDQTFGTAAVTSVSQLRVSRVGIRNVIKVVYTDATSGDRNTVTSTDATSVTKYGRRIMEVAEAGTSNIDSSAEATTMADAILSDLKEPNADMTVETMAFPFAETADLYRYTANGKHFSANQDLAVVSWSTRFERDRSKTTVQVRGVPSGGFARWLGAEARPGQAPATDTDPPEKPTNVSAIAKLSGLEISFDMPRALDWAYSEVYLSKTTGFSPGLDTKVGDGRSNKFFITGLEPNTVYYFKVVSIDNRGNRSTVSDQSQQTTGTAGTAHINWDSAFDGNIVPNGDFQVWSAPASPDNAPPDFWECVYVPGALGTSDVVDNTLWRNTPEEIQGVWYDRTLVSTGNRSIRFRRNLPYSGSNVLYGIRTTRLLPIRGGSLYQFSLRGLANSTQINGAFACSAVYYDQNGTLISTQSFNSVITSERRWTTNEFAEMAPTSATFVRFYFLMSETVAPKKSCTYFLDKLTMREVGSAVTLFNAGGGGGDKSIVPSTWTIANLPNLRLNMDVGGVTLSGGGFEHQFVCQWPGLYLIIGNVNLTALAIDRSLQAGIYINGALIKTGTTANGPTGGTVSAQVVHMVSLTSGDIVTLYMKHEDTVNRTEGGDETRQALSVYCLRRF